MGYSVALLGGLAQAAGGIAAAERQAKAQAQAEAETQMAVQAQQAQIAAQADEQAFNRRMTEEKLGLERRKLQHDIDTSQGRAAGKPAPQIDPDEAAIKAVNRRFKLGRGGVTGGSVYIDPLTGEKATSEAIKAVADRARAAATPAAPVGAAATPAAPVGAVTSFDAQQVAQALATATPDAAAAILEQMTDEQAVQVNEITRTTPKVAPGGFDAPAFQAASPTAQEEVAKQLTGEDVFADLGKLRKRTEPKPLGKVTPRGPTSANQRAIDETEKINRQLRAGRISTKAADKAFAAVAAKVAARARPNAPQR